jgi:hypothetical protein
MSFPWECFAVPKDSAALQDMVVAGVAFALGALALASALLNLEWAHRLRKAQWVEARYGRRGARLAFALVGAALVALGVAIIAR